MTIALIASLFLNLVLLLFATTQYIVIKTLSKALVRAAMELIAKKESKSESIPPLEFGIKVQMCDYCSSMNVVPTDKLDDSYCTACGASLNEEGGN